MIRVCDCYPDTEVVVWLSGSDEAKLTVPARPEIERVICDYSFPAIMAAAVREKWTRDPFDRVIVAHARANQRTSLISPDRTIRKHYTETVW